MFWRRRPEVRLARLQRARTTALLRDVGLPDRGTRAQLIRELERQRVLVPSLPEAIDDTNDLEHLLRSLPPQGLAAKPSVGWRAVTRVGIEGRKPHYHIKVRVVLCADSDGSHSVTVDESSLTDLFTALSSFYYFAGLSFTHTTTTLHDTIINQDFTLPDGADLTSPDEPITEAQRKASFADHNDARSAWARLHRGELVVFFRYGTSVKWDDNAKHWNVGPATFAFSGAEHEFVAMGTNPEAVLLAHESGHYFHLSHTQYGTVSLTDADKKKYPDPDGDPADHEGRRLLLRGKAIEAIRSYVDDKGHPPELGQNALDADGLADTPPDPGPTLCLYEFGDACALKPLAVDVDLVSGSRTYTLDPDRGLIMSYFFRCPGGKRFSNQQIDRIRASLEQETFPPGTLSRHHLIALPLKPEVPKAVQPRRIPSPVLSRLTASLRGAFGRTQRGA